jgi:hypothetical protein
MQGRIWYSRINLTNRWTSRLGFCLFRPNFILIVGVRLPDAAALVNSMLCPFGRERRPLTRGIVKGTLFEKETLCAKIEP